VLAEHVTTTSLPAQRFLGGAAGLFQRHGADVRHGAAGALLGAAEPPGGGARLHDVFALIVLLFLAGYAGALPSKTEPTEDRDFMHE
jgi:hypothetical protein